MKFIIILFFEIMVFQLPTHEITFQISSPEKQPAKARVLIFQNGTLLKDLQTKGAFSTFLPAGLYALHVIRCATSHVLFKAVRKKVVWTVINTDCVQ